MIAYFHQEDEQMTVTNEKLLEAIARENMDVHVARVTDPSLRAKYPLQGDQNTVVFTNFKDH